MSPMATTGQEAVGSMGTDTPISALSSKSKLLHTYFKQNFAQVTNPPIDPIREELVMSLVSFIGPRPNILDLEGTSRHKRLEVYQPILTNEDLERIRAIGEVKDNVRSPRSRSTSSRRERGRRHGRGARLRARGRGGGALQGVQHHHPVGPRLRARPHPDPVAARDLGVHHHLIKRGLRTSVGLVVETGEAHEVHQFCTLAGYGAEAVNPYLAFETLEAMIPDIGLKLAPEDGRSATSRRSARPC